MRDRTMRSAEHFGLLDRLRALEAKLLKLKYIDDVDFDVDNFDEIPQVILIPHYTVPVDDPSYFSLQQNTLANVLITCGNFDLWPSGDAIEDMGEHWYIVRRAGESWPRRVRWEETSRDPWRKEAEAPTAP